MLLFHILKSYEPAEDRKLEDKDMSSEKKQSKELVHRRQNENVDTDLTLFEKAKNSIYGNMKHSIHSLTGHVFSITKAILTPNNRFIVTVSRETIRLWDILSGRYLFDYKEQGSFAGFHCEPLAITPDGKRLIACSGHKIGIWNLFGGNLIKTFECDLGFDEICAAPDNRHIIAGGYQDQASDDRPIESIVTLLDCETGQRRVTYVGHTETIRALTVSRDGASLVTGSWDHTAKLWNMSSGQCLKTFIGHKDSICSVAISADGKYLLTGSKDHRAKLWYVKTGDCLMSFECEGWVEATYFLDKSRTVLTASNSNMQFWDVASGQCKRTVQMLGRDGPIASATLGFDKRSILTLSNHGHARVWSYPGGICQATIGDHDYGSKGIELSDDIQLAKVGSNDSNLIISNKKRLALYDLKSGRPIMDLNDCDGEFKSFRKGNSGKPNSFCGLPDNGGLAAGCENGSIVLLDKSGESIGVLYGHNGPVRSVCVTPDMKHIISESEDKTVLVWRLEDKECIRTFEGIETFESVTPDGKTLLAYSNQDKDYYWGCAKAFDMATGNCLWTHSWCFMERTSNSSWDNKYVVLRNIGQEGPSWVRDISTGECVATLDVKGFGRYCSFGGVYLAIAGWSSLKVWDTRTWECIREFDIEDRFHRVTALGDNRLIVESTSGLGTRIYVWDISSDETTFVCSDSDLLVSSDGRLLITYCWSNRRINFRSLPELSLLCSMYSLSDGFLWAAHADQANAPLGCDWFWTNRKDLITVYESDANENSIQVIDRDGPRFEKYFAAHNRQDVVMARISDPKKYEELVEIDKNIRLNHAINRRKLNSGPQSPRSLPGSKP